MPKLIILTEGGSERDVSLDGDSFTIGRDPSSDVALLEEALVSPHHASFREENNRWYLRDEGSSHGTFVNARRVKDQGLQDGDVIELGLGGPTLRFEAGEDEREKGNATTAGRLKQYYEHGTGEPAPEPLEGAGKIAVPVAARGVLYAIGGIALVAAGAMWVSGRDGGIPQDAVGSQATPSSPTAMGGVLYPLQSASRTYFQDLERMRMDAERERAGAPRRSRIQQDLESVVASIEAGVGDAGVRDSLEARRAVLEDRMATADRLAEVAGGAAGSLLLIQVGFEVDGHYFPGPTGTGFYAGDGGSVITSRHVVAPESYIRSADEAVLACALKGLTDQGKAPLKVISIWGPGSTPGLLDRGGLDPATATLSSVDGRVEEAGVLGGDADQPRPFGCSAGGVVESQHVDDRIADLALLRVSGGSGEALPLAEAGPEEEELVLLAGFPRGILRDAAGGLAPWSTYGSVVSTGDRILFDVPVLTGTDGAPLLDADGRVVGVGVTTREGRGVALPVRHVLTLLNGS